MFTSVWQEYKEYFKKNDSYYEIKVDIDKIFNNNSAKIFIDEHFQKGQKSQALETAFCEEYEKHGKHVHTVSLYLMGLYLQHLFDNDTKKALSKIINDISWYDFRYVWYLTALYHDVASCAEQKSVIMRSDNRTPKRSLNAYLKKSDRTYSIYNHTLCNGKKFKPRFKQSLIYRYFSYRAANFNIDHGIIGGILLFNKLTEKHNEILKDQDSLYDRSLIWKKEHIDLFAYIADAIICHNIWLNGDANTYRGYGLEELLVDRNTNALKLSLSDYPLQFFLCLLDTIEPVKKFQDMSAEKVLSSIYIECSERISENEKTEIKIRWKREMQEHPNFLNWITSIKNMENWMDIDIVLLNENSDRNFNYICDVEDYYLLMKF